MQDQEDALPSLPNLPKSIGQGLLWIMAAAALATWAGWLQPPGSVQAAAELRARVAEQQAREAERSIAVLQYQQDATNQELKRINGKLDDMSMVLYSLERRSR
jgi:nitrogen fixation protein FixH